MSGNHFVSRKKLEIQAEEPANSRFKERITWEPSRQNYRSRITHLEALFGGPVSAVEEFHGQFCHTGSRDTVLHAALQALHSQQYNMACVPDPRGTTRSASVTVMSPWKASFASSFSCKTTANVTIELMAAPKYIMRQAYFLDLCLKFAYTWALVS